MINVQSNLKQTNPKQYDLEERTTQLAIAVINFANSLSKDDVSKILKNQFIKAGTSIGANYCKQMSAAPRRILQAKFP